MFGVIVLLSKIILWIILIGPWFTLLLLKKERVKHFMPVGILASFLMVLYNLIAYNQQHWVIKVSILPWLKPIFASGILGTFLVTTIWIFHFTYHKLWLYLITNIVVDFLFTVFPIHFLFQNILGIYQLVNITPWNRWLIFVFLSIVIYVYQNWLDEVLKPI
jgi:hypothetical protein